MTASPPTLPCFVISLEKDKDRRAVLTDQLSRLGLPYTLFPAVNGKALCAEELSLHYDRQRALSMRRELALSEIGCALSHRGVWQAIVAQDLPAALVLEDDASPDATTPEVVAALAACLNPEEPIVTLLSFVRRYWRQHQQPLGSAHHWVNTYGLAVNSHGYIITRRAAQVLSRQLYPVWIECDRWQEFAAAGLIHVKAVVPFCIGTNRAFESNLEDERATLKNNYDYQQRWRNRAERVLQLVTRPFLQLEKQKRPPR